MTTTTDAPAQTYAQIPVGAIDPDPNNRTSATDKDFVTSIKEHGVVEPIIVVPHPDNPDRYLLVAGERRWRGATTAELATIPAIVRTDLDTEALRIELQVVENLQRTDLKPCEEAQQLMRLADVGYNVKQLAAKISRSQRYVRDRLKLAELPAKGRKLVDDGTWSIEEGLAAFGLLDHPDKLDELIASPPRNVAWTVEDVTRRIEWEAAAVVLVEGATAKGQPLIDDSTGTTPVHTLGIEPKDHAKETCHALVLSGSPMHAGKPSLQAVCTDAKRHKTKGASTLKSPTKPGLNDDEKNERREKKEAAEARAGVMSAFATGKVAKTHVYDLILETLISGAGQEVNKAVVKLLDLPPVDGPYGPSEGDTVRAYAAKSEPNRLRIATAIAMVSHELSFTHGWGSEAQANRWADFLKNRGWKPMPWDTQRLKKSRR